MPANLYMLSPHMFDGCSNLRTVKFENGSILKQIGDHVFANCPKLTSIVLPASIDSIEYIDAQFLAGSSIDEVTFNGENYVLCWYPTLNSREPKFNECMHLMQADKEDKIKNGQVECKYLLTEAQLKIKEYS